MTIRGMKRACRPRAWVTAFSAVALLGILCLPASAQFGRYSSVGGVLVDASGVLSNASVDQSGELAKLMKESLQPVPGEMNQVSAGRKISLRQLEAAVAEFVQQKKPIPDEIRFLAGLQSIDYVFVDTKNKDIVLVGPAQGWKVGPKGEVVGSENGQPVLMLDDLVIALRSARNALQGPISVSIDPTPEGVRRVQAFSSRLSARSNPQETLRGIEQAMGPQTITLTGVPETSHFARVLVAADYRLKRISLGFDPSPVPGLADYPSLLQARRAKVTNMTPRWWLEPRFESVVHSPDGLAWQFQGASVKAMTESAVFGAAGQRKLTGKVDKIAQQWADAFTAKYDQLATADPVFGELRNCMQLAIVGALIVKEDLTNKAGYSMPTLLEPTAVEVAAFPAPKHVQPIAKAVRLQRETAVMAAGGVQINVFEALKDAKTSDALDATRTKAIAANKTWWWD